MRTIRFLIVLIVCLGFLVTPARAQELERVGFLVLVKNPQADKPLWVQVHQAFDHVRPHLQALKSRGVILNFDLIASIGIVRVQYTTSAAGDPFAHSEIFNDIDAAVAQVSLDRIMSSSPATSGPHFTIDINDSQGDSYGCFVVKNAPSYAYITSFLINPAGVGVAKHVGTARYSGLMFGCLKNNSDEDAVTSAGYKFVSYVYEKKGGALLGTYTVIVPKFKLTAINTAGKLISGSGPVGESFTVRLAHLILGKDSINDYLYTEKNGVVTNKNTWSIDFKDAEIRGGDQFEISLQHSSRFTFQFTQPSPFIYCDNIFSTVSCELHSYPFKQVSLSVTRNNATDTTSGKADWNGAFYPKDSQGITMAFLPGDIVAATDIATYRFPGFTGELDSATGRLTGKAPANKYVWIEAYDEDDYNSGIPTSSLWAKTDASGNYVANFSSVGGINDGWTFVIVFINPSTGFRIYYKLP